MPRSEGADTKLRSSLRPSALIPTVTAGLVIGVLEVILAISFAALVFGGDLAVHLPKAIGLALLGGALMLAVTSLVGDPQMMGSAQDIPAAVLGVVGGGIGAALGAGSERAFLTVVLAVALTTLLTGTVFVMLGVFRLGNLVRFAPYPVVGGFLAGTGWLLFKGGLGVLTGIPFTLGTLDRYVTGDAIPKWVAGVAFAVVLVVLVRRVAKPLVVPATVAAGLAVFYGVMLASGSNVPELEAAGWLVGPLPDAGLWEPWLLEAPGKADWGAIVSQIPGMLTAVALSVVALLLNVTGLELAFGRDVDANRELRAGGLANLSASLVGGLPGFHALSLSVLAHRMGARSRGTGLFAAAVVGLALLFGASAIALLPRAIVGGLIVFLGLSFLVDWVWDARVTLARIEYVLVLGILVVIGAFGFLQGVAVGLAAAILLFVREYSRTRVVRHAMSGATFRSSVDRATEERDALDRGGTSIMVLVLEGFLFFGTAHGLAERVRDRLRLIPPLRFVVLDLRRVRGIDSSAVMSLAKITSMATQHGFSLVLAAPSEHLTRALARGGVDPADEGVLLFHDADRALQWCEDRILEAAGVDPAPESRPLEGWLRESGQDIETARLLPYLERVEVPAGQELMRRGEKGDDLFFVESGRLAAEIESAEGKRVRLRAVTPGAVVGELALYLGTLRTASVIAETDATLYRLSRRQLEAMQRDDPDVAAAVHRTLARLLADRLAGTVRTIEALLE